MPVELVWDGKYVNGKKTAPVRLPLPFQDVETVNESAHDRNLMLDLWGQNKRGEWRNRLIWGDKKYVLPSLLPEFAGRVNLIYIDPPFATGADFSFTATIPNDSDDNGTSATFTKQPSVIEQKAYRDTWGRGLDGYLQWFYETVVLLHELLAEDGSLYIHLDWHVVHYAKSVLDEVFGIDRFLNDIIWQRTASHNDPRRYGIVHDVLLFYTKSQKYTWNDPKEAHSAEYIDSFFLFAESPVGEIRRLKKGEDSPPGWRRFRLGNFASPHPRPNLTYEYKGYKPPKNGWKVSLEKMKELDKEGRLWFPQSKEGRIQTKSYLDELSEGKSVPDLWLGMMALQSQSGEKVDYATQKPEALLERIIRASSNEGDLVLDCFAGSGTTAAVAEKLGRRWITADLGRFAIHTTRKRLLAIPDVKPFVVQNLGKYERQAWQSAEFGDDRDRAAQAQTRYRRFILDLYGGQPLDGYTWLHGVRAGHLVHVGSVDTPVLLGDVKAIAQEFWKAVGKKTGAQTNTVDVLGWDFAFEINEMGKQMAADANIRMLFKRIPREVLEKKAVEQGDIRFFELAALGVDVRATGKRGVQVDLTDFVVPPDDVPDEVQRAITHWSQWIDYWAIDWDFKGDTFHNQWQSYRTKKDNKLQLSRAHTYDAPGTYTIVVKVIDILGNDTTKSLQVEVK